jgi:hypothetical protein
VPSPSGVETMTEPRRIGNDVDSGAASAAARRGARRALRQSSSGTAGSPGASGGRSIRFRTSRMLLTPGLSKTVLRRSPGRRRVQRRPSIVIAEYRKDDDVAGDRHLVIVSEPWRSATSNHEPR